MDIPVVELSSVEPCPRGWNVTTTDGATALAPKGVFRYNGPHDYEWAPKQGDLCVLFPAGLSFKYRAWHDVFKCSGLLEDGALSERIVHWCPEGYKVGDNWDWFFIDDDTG